MSSVTEEIRQLQLRILELEKQQKERDEIDKKTSIDHNFKVINNVLSEKKTGLIIIDILNQFHWRNIMIKNLLHI